jgi:very-short-patch-repair endonuclease
MLRSRRLWHAKFRRHTPIGSWIVDCASFRYHLIVDADGSQHVDNARDQLRDNDLMRRGFQVLRFWNNDILTKTAAVAERIADAIKNTPHPASRLTALSHPLPQGERGRERV